MATNDPVLGQINYTAPNVTAGAQQGLTYPSNSQPFSVTDPTAVQGANTGAQVIYGVNDPGTLAALAQGITSTQNQLGALDTQQNVGTQNIQNAYNQAFNQLLQGKTNAQGQYQQGKTTNSQNYVTAKNTIGAGAGQSLNSLLRLLGARGAGGSSAALIAAPQAVATQASQQRGQAGQAYGQNAQGLDTGWNNYLTGYNNSQLGLNDQKANNLSTLQQQIASSRANLLNSLAQLQGQYAAATGANPTTAAQPYLDQSNQYLQQAAGLGLQQYSFNPQTPAYTPPSLASYTTNPYSTPQVANQGAIGDQVSPYLSTLLRQKTPGTVSA